jgi:VanZ family protein
VLPISTLIRNIPVFGYLDFLKVGHVIGYFWLGLTVFYALSLQARWLHVLHPTVAAVALCALYAMTDEIHQLFVPGRSSLAQDVLLDTLASLAGVVTLFVIVKITIFLKRQRTPTD